MKSSAKGPTVGIIGFGSFGKLLAEKLDSHCHVLVYSKSGKQNQWAASLKDVSRADFVILAIPLNAYTEVLKQLRPLLGAATVVVDVASVKVVPTQLLQKLLPGRPILVTHPLFGPESAKDSVAGHRLVLCPEVSDPASLEVVKHFAEELGLKVVEISAKEHDQEMSVVQGLTFFIARCLKGMNLQEQTLSTPTFEKLLKLAEVESHHSPDLFHTIQAGNPMTDEVRETFIKHAIKINKGIIESKNQ